VHGSGRGEGRGACNTLKLKKKKPRKKGHHHQETQQSFRSIRKLIVLLMMFYVTPLKRNSLDKSYAISGRQRPAAAGPKTKRGTFRNPGVFAKKKNFKVK